MSFSTSKDYQYLFTKKVVLMDLGMAIPNLILTEIPQPKPPQLAVCPIPVSGVSPLYPCNSIPRFLAALLMSMISSPKKSLFSISLRINSTAFGTLHPSTITPSKKNGTEI